MEIREQSLPDGIYVIWSVCLRLINLAVFLPLSLSHCALSHAVHRGLHFLYTIYIPVYGYNVFYLCKQCQSLLKICITSTYYSFISAVNLWVQV